jgi:hypothetical protein
MSSISSPFPCSGSTTVVSSSGPSDFESSIEDLLPVPSSPLAISLRHLSKPFFSVDHAPKKPATTKGEYILAPEVRRCECKLTILSLKILSLSMTLVLVSEGC